MAEHYYSTQPFLAWCFNHYFYGKQHFAWLASPFYPYRLPNPRSSSPLRIYEDMYEPWKDEDEFSKLMAGMRAGVHKGVIENRRLLSASRAAQMRRICEQIHIRFLYPIVYRVDIDNIEPASRLEKAGSGQTVGSIEYRVEALQEAAQEFDILFFDIEAEKNISPALQSDILALWDDKNVSEMDALAILWRWRQI